MSAVTTPNVRFFKYVPSAQAPGGGLDDAAVDARIAPYARTVPTGTIADAQIPAEIMRDTELTAAAVRTVLGLTEQQVNDLFTGASINSNTITYTQTDGTTVDITVPSGMGGMPDGVVTGVALAGTVLTLTIDTDGVETTVDVNLNALRTGYLTQTQFDNQRGNRLQISRTTVYDSAAHTLTLSVDFSLVVGDFCTFLSPATIGTETEALDIVEDVTGGSGTTFALVDRDGAAVAASQMSPGRLYEIIRLATLQGGQFRILEPLGERAVQDHTRYGATKATNDFESRETSPALMVSTRTRTRSPRQRPPLTTISRLLSRMTLQTRQTFEKRALTTTHSLRSPSMPTKLPSAPTCTTCGLVASNSSHSTKK